MNEFMKPVFQTRFTQTDGNCWPACLASFFEVPLEEVDHCHCGKTGWEERSQEWLAKRGLRFLQLHLTGGEWHWTGLPAGHVCLAGGITENGSSHVVVVRIRMKNGKGFVQQIHDPTRGGKGLVELKDIIIFIPICT